MSQMSWNRVLHVWHTHSQVLLCELLQNRVETTTKTSTKYLTGRHTTMIEWQGLDIKPWNSCDNVRLCLVQDRRRAHALHILIENRGKPSRTSSYMFITASHISHIQLDITVFTYTAVTEVTAIHRSHRTHRLSQISHITIQSWTI